MIGMPRKNKLEQKMQQNEQVYRQAGELFGGSSRVFRYYAQSDEISMDLLTAADVPRPGVVSYSTVGLQQHSVGLRSDGKPLRIEILAAGYARYEHYPDLLSGCSFAIINADFACAEGAVYRDSVNMYVQGSPMRHLLFAKLSLWGKEPVDLEFEDKKTIWLTAIPISDGELAFFEENGTYALLERLKLAGADLFDLKRPTVLA